MTELSEGMTDLSGAGAADGPLDFCMCNPPFFARPEEAHAAAHYRACAGNPGEMVCPGGEVSPAARLRALVVPH